jgi:lipopolysaccharide transport system permease protein
MLKAAEQLSIIRPDSRLKTGLLLSTLHLIKEIVAFRSHIRIVYDEQFRAAYRGSGLGVVWNYVIPIVPLTIYMVLSRLRAVPNFQGVDSATFITFGVTLWLLFSGCIQVPINTIQSRNKDAMKTAFPLSAAIAAGFARLVFDTAVRVLFVVFALVMARRWPAWEAIFLPLLLLPALLFCIGIGLILGVANIIYTDVSRVVNIALQYGIFLSGVVFPLPSSTILHALNGFNPLAIFIDAFRSITFNGILHNDLIFISLSAVSVVTFFVACRLFYIMECRIRGIS